MNESIGQALRSARLKRNLSVEEVARATKIRADRVTELEQDDYTHFPNLTYARNFLILYAKYVGVDISKYPTVEVGSTIGLGDYQYLRREERESTHRADSVPTGPPEKPRWLIVFFVFVLMVALGALVAWGIMNFRRLGPMESFGKKDAEALTAPTPPPAHTPLPTVTPTPLPMPSATPAVAPSPEGAAQDARAGSATAVVPNPVQGAPQANVQPAEAMASPSPEPEVRRAEPAATGNSVTVLPAEPVTAAATPVPSPAATFPPPGAMREIKVHATKKIRVRIAHDSPNASSDYLGNMNPAMAPRTFKGKHFYIKTTDPDALEVTIDGQPATGPESGVEIVKSPEL